MKKGKWQVRFDLMHQVSLNDLWVNILPAIVDKRLFD